MNLLSYMQLPKMNQ